ncbi:MAG TPA: EscU/YscU/HrcU family type III secretion system export apparatus switch protein [Rickettsiales bacterium]|nr:EscU/YscU/HrcU family type III secretion system export apparatus switch protein [Rickettsiales bacterium]
MADETDKKEKKPVAVALKYEPEKEHAPRVAAKGQGLIAEQIIKIAQEHGITIHEDAGLVEILSKLDLDTIIPIEAYAAVAEILNYVYRSNAKAKNIKKAAK